jgi:hypothetical protein
MKVYKSEIVFPIRFENSLVAKPHNCLAPLAPAGGSKGRGGMRVEEHWFARVGVYGFLLHTDRRSMLRAMLRRTGL